MAYEVPTRWTHGSFPEAAGLNKYTNSLEALYASLVAGGSMAARARRATTDEGQTGESAPGFHMFVHHNRWLHYRTVSGETGTIVDIAGIQDDVALPEATTGMTPYDLWSLSWLSLGQLYKVTGCVFAVEDQDP
jgi:hypothetical protein